MQKEEKRILIVDDDDAIRALLITIMRRHGMAVDTAKNGAEGLQKLGECRYVLMLLDLMMPVVTGWEVLEQLGNAEPASRPLVIVLTAGGEPRDFDADLVVGSIRKPFDVELLSDMVAACIGTVSKRQQLAECPPSEANRKRLS